jgi:phage shock protein E
MRFFLSPLLLLSIVLLSACGLGAQSTAAVKSMTPAELQALPRSADWQILDVRTPEEVAEGFIPAASHFLDFYAPDFATRLEKLDRNKKWVVYCRSGKRSSQAAQLMIDKGFTQVYNLQGGISSWTGNIEHGGH